MHGFSCQRKWAATPMIKSFFSRRPYKPTVFLIGNERVHPPAFTEETV